MSAHARLSPSGAHRWMRCPGSVVLEAGLPDTAGSYAAEGTVAHEIASKVLTEDDYEIPVGETVEVDGHKIPVTRAMADYVHDYVKLVRELAGADTLLVEQKVDFSHVIDVPDSFGTSDVIIIRDNEVVVIDLKYGMGVKVDAEANEQLQLYALGALAVAELVAEVEYVTMVIHQPRLDHVSEWTIPVQDLRAFGDRAAKAACDATDGLADGAQAPHFQQEYLQPGEKQCRFCKAKATCPALREEIMLNVGGAVNSPATVEEFAQFLPIAVDMEVGDNYLSIAMSKVGMVEDWCKAVRAEVERRLLAGQAVQDYKLVRGKQGNRAWSNPDEVETIMKKSWRLRDDQMYEQKLISPTEAEKRLKENPKRWEKLQPLISRAEGKLSVASATDKRPEVVVSNTLDEAQRFVNEVQE